jgi:hypothetical protein
VASVELFREHATICRLAGLQFCRFIRAACALMRRCGMRMLFSTSDVRSLMLAFLLAVLGGGPNAW